MTTNWTDGYVADIAYTYGYYTELNPARVALAFLNAGLVAPSVGTACELGFGQGMSTNVHAAASVINWYGTDFNPSQAGFAQELAQISGSGAQLFDQAFADFCRRTDLPSFDYIGLHGIWSWISDDNRAVIVDFIHRQLKVGGVLYISYNTLPGWAAFAPLRHLMTEHAEILGSEGRGIISRIEGAIEFADQLLAQNPLFSRANPLVSERVKKLKEQNGHYLAHEYFNRDWHPMHFATMGKWLVDAKVQFACSAHYLDAIDSINLTAEQQQFLKDIPDPMFRQSVRDFCVNQQFRRDYWVKGLRRLNPLEQAEVLRKQRVILMTPRAQVSLKVTGSLGEAEMHEAVYAPILDVLAEGKPKSLGQIERALSGQNIGFAQMMQAIMVLMGAQHLAAVQEDAVVNKVKKQTDRFNLHVMNQSRGSQDMAYLASPVTGGGIAVDRFQQLFILALSQGHKQPADWARFVWQILQAQGQNLVKDGQVLSEPEQNIEELTQQALRFSETRLPLLKSLGVV